MHKIITIFICLLSFVFVNAQTKSRNLEKLIQQQKAAIELLDSYKFSEAATQLEEDIEFAEKKRLATDTLESYLDFANMGQNMLTSTEKVVFIDSVVIDKNRFLEVYKMSEESGDIDLFKNVFKSQSASSEVENSFTYIPQLRDKVYFSNVVDSAMYIFTRDRLDDTWSDPIQAEGLEDFGYDQISPFVLNDGTTMYFAAKGEQSLGGYDIFLTRYSTDNGKFLRPENIGMPFNSPDNDYMYAIDEANNIGWFVSDRRQPVGKVCVYVFIPNATRENYTIEPGDTLQSFAKINAIRDTWKGNSNRVNEALNRLKNLLSAKKQNRESKDFMFVVNDSKVYTSLDDFQNPEAKKYASQWIEAKKMLEQQNAQLEADRSIYASAQNSQKKELTPTILEEEKQTSELKEFIKKLEKLIRQSELTDK